MRGVSSTATSGIAVRSGLKRSCSRPRSGSVAGVKTGVDHVGELGLACAVMCERQQADHSAAGLPLAVLGQQRFECAGIGTAREQLIAIDKVEQCHRLLAQRVDDVTVVDHVTVLAAGLGRSTAPQGQEPRRAEEAIESIIVEVNIQPVADQTRGDAIEDAPQDEAAARGNENTGLLVVGRSSVRQSA